MRILRVSFILGVVLFACTGSDPNFGSSSGSPASSGGAGDGGATSGSFALVAPAPVLIGASSSVKVAVKIERRDGFTGAVKIVAQPMPDGTACAPLVLEGTSTTGELTITSTPTAAQAKVTLDLVATGEPSLVDRKDLLLRVRGKAGDRDTTFGELDAATTVSGISAPFYAPGDEDSLYLLGARPGGGFELRHLLIDGAVDAAFGTGGIAPVKGDMEGFNTLVRAKDGKLVAYAYSLAASNLSVHRFLANGSYDTAFGTEGIATVTGVSSINGLAVDDQGGVLVAFASDPTRIRIRRLLPTDGQPDAAFDAKDLGSPDTFATWPLLLLRADGTPVLVGSQVNAGVLRSAAAILTTTASPTVTQPTSWATFNLGGAKLDATGRILFVGSGTYGPTDPTYAFLMRTKADGTVDPTFAGGLPIVDYDATSPNDQTSYEDVFVDEAGKVLVAGDRHDGATSAAKGSILARYDDAGKLDPSFGTGGRSSDATAPGSSHFGASMQTSLPTLVVLRQAPAGDATIAIRYWR